MKFPSRKSLLIGMGEFAGFCGSILGQSPMASLLEAGVAWRTFVLASVAIPTLIAVFSGATWWWLRCGPPQRTRATVVHDAVLPFQPLDGSSPTPKADSSPKTPAMCPGKPTERPTNAWMNVAVLTSKPSNESSPTPISGNSSTMTSATSPGKPTERPMNAWQRLTAAICNRNNLALCAVGFFNVAVLNTFASLWGPPFLQAVHGMSRETAAVVSSAVLLGWGLSAPLQGWAGDHVSKPVALACASVSGAVAMTLVVYVPGMSPVLLFVLLYVAGMATPIPLMFVAVRFSTIAHVLLWLAPHLGWGLVRGRLWRTMLQLSRAQQPLLSTPASCSTARFCSQLYVARMARCLHVVASGPPRLTSPLEHTWQVSALLLAGDDAPELGPDGEEVYSAAAYKLGMGVFPVTFACAAILSLWLIWQRPATSAVPAPPSAKQPPRVLLDVESGFTTDSDSRAAAFSPSSEQMFEFPAEVQSTPRQ